MEAQTIAPTETLHTQDRQHRNERSLANYSSFLADIKSQLAKGEWVSLPIDVVHEIYGVSKSTLRVMAERKWIIRRKIKGGTFLYMRTRELDRLTPQVLRLVVNNHLLAINERHVIKKNLTLPADAAETPPVEPVAESPQAQPDTPIEEPAEKPALEAYFVMVLPVNRVINQVFREYDKAVSWIEKKGSVNTDYAICQMKEFVSTTLTLNRKPIQ
ncbi:hypothetical protein [Spirosoma sordidisoli]|uniref:Uncharacterized protein n=1 Tax=Spirosoma sordidisoli TaxID=2502893 RepID=A0A4Q2UPE8_9BACT|nr:hypothetical protein [Spirosoma sordidisoli]RYC69671.1 hypothetical protein EQG79_13805 [Spirosoma sordidisoli]